LRGSWRHFGPFLSCVALGVTAIVAVASLAASLEATVAASARALLGGDLEISSTRPLSEAARAELAALERQGVRVTHVTDLAAMASAATSETSRGGTGPPTVLVELRAVEGGYPLYGALAADPPGALGALIGQGRAIAHPSLLDRLAVRVGDRLQIGRAHVTISARLTSEPDRGAGVFALGPRMLVAAADLERTGLVQPGSRVTYRALLRLPDGWDAEALRGSLGRRLLDPPVRLRTFAEAQPGLRRLWDQLTTYLGLAGLVALLVGGVGVAVSVRAFIRERRDAIAVLKCVGAGWLQIFITYLVLAGTLGLLGSLVGAALGSALQWALAPVLAPLMPLPVTLHVSPTAIARGLAMGAGVTLLSAVWPLLEIRRVRPAIILRRTVDPEARAHRPWLATLPIALGLAALALWQAGSWKAGGWFVGGTVAAGGLLLAGSRLIAALAPRLPRPRSLAWRQALAALHRPGSHAGAVLVSLGLAVTLVVSLALLDGSLAVQIGEASARDAPAFFFVDVQADQVEPFSRLVARLGGRAPATIPVVRSRLRAVNARSIPSTGGPGLEEWALRREYVLTWAAEPPPRNLVVRGRWWTPEEAAREGLVSVEEDIARQLGVDLGGTLTFDVQGVPVTGRVASIRHVDWRSFQANFFVIFSPGALAGAPGTFIATARVAPPDEARVQSAVVAAFPNVTAIPVREILERLGRTVDQIALAIRLVAAFAIVSAVVVLAGALTVTRRQRLYESVILKALGATRGRVARAFAAEYALLGAAAGLGGTGLACLLAWVVLRWVLDVPWSWQPVILLLGVGLSVLLCVAVGCLATFRILGQRPLPILREE
jgi:putative ABC transport system permease protein